MRLERYYRTLGLPEGASKSEVRKQYRRLVMKYHPDKNPSKSANVKFIAITEAYEILCGKRPAPAKHIRSTSRSSNGKTHYQSNTEKQNVREEQIRQARKKYQEQILRERIENERYFQKLTSGVKWKTIRISAIVGIVLSVLLLADRFLPHHYEADRVTHYAMTYSFNSRGERLSVVQTEREQTHWISYIRYDLYGRYPSILTETSWFFHHPIQLKSIGKVAYTNYRVYYTFHTNFILAIAFFLVPAFTLWYKRRTITFTILYHIAYFGSNVLMLIFLFTNDRWAHLLTLGFF